MIIIMIMIIVIMIIVIISVYLSFRDVSLNYGRNPFKRKVLHVMFETSLH